MSIISLDYHTQALAERFARAIEKIADRKASVEPLFIFLPSDITPEDAKKLGETLADAFRGRI